MDPKKLTRHQTREALDSLINLAKERDGHTKARCATNSSKQRIMEGYKKEDATSPTIHNKIVFITADIEASKGRDVMILGITGTFLHDLPKDGVIMLARGPLADTVMSIDPEGTTLP